MFDITKTTETLEAMIDKHGLGHVLTGLELVCREKADHLRHNWQDSGLAKEWDRQAKKLAALAAALPASVF